MAKQSLAEKIALNKQRKERVQQREARLKKEEQQERMRRLIELGSLAEKAGIHHLSASALFRCFTNIANDSSDPVKVAAWESEGQKLLAPATKPLSLAEVRFADKSKLTAETKDTLRQLGFRENRLRESWEGRVQFDEASTVVIAAGGKIAKINDVAV